MSNYPLLTWSFFFLGLFFLGLLVLYLLGSLPNFLYNPPDLEAYSNVVNKSSPLWDAYLLYWPKSTVSLTIFLAAFFSFLFGAGSYRKSKGQEWTLIKKDISTNLLSYGLLALGIFLFLALWPTDPFGTFKWSLITLIPLSILSFVFLLPKPIGEKEVRSMTPEQFEAQKSSYEGAKTFWLVTTSIPFFIGLALLATSFLTPQPENDPNFGALVTFMFGVLSLLISIVPLLIYLYFRGKSRKFKDSPSNKET